MSSFYLHHSLFINFFWLWAYWFFYLKQPIVCVWLGSASSSTKTLILWNLINTLPSLDLIGDLGRLDNRVGDLTGDREAYWLGDLDLVGDLDLEGGVRDLTGEVDMTCWTGERDLSSTRRLFSGGLSGGEDSKYSSNSLMSHFPALSWRSNSSRSSAGISLSDLTASSVCYWMKKVSMFNV